MQKGNKKFVVCLKVHWNFKVLPPILYTTIFPRRNIIEGADVVAIKPFLKII